MQSRRPVERLARALAVMLMLAGAVAGTIPAAASAATCQSWSGLQPPSPGAAGNELSGVTVLSPCNAWTVGSFNNSSGQQQTLVEHWNGAAWTVVPSPDPGSVDDGLNAVRAVSASDIWAVGADDIPGIEQTLIVRWDGHAWSKVTSPSPGANNNLAAVRAVSANNAWAVGSYVAGGMERTLIVHWNGTKWTQVTSPSPGQGGGLDGITATSASNAWAVGESFGTSGASQTLILHWNGTTWSQVTSPSPGQSSRLNAVAATSASNAWAVGSSFDASGISHTLILHWNGTTWSQVTSPNLGGASGFDFLNTVTATSASNAWAAGSYTSGPGTPENVLLLQWNGSAWQAVPGPTLGTTNRVFGVAASSSSNVWAVGEFSNGGVVQALALHCC
jgi:hypothetical protein